MRKQWQLPQIQEPASVQELANELSIHPLLAGMLFDRGIKTAAAAQQFFQPKLSDLHDPFQMKDLAKAVERILQAAEKGDKVLLYGDYDVDGTSSVALMYAFLESLSMDLDYYIPNRHSEGYGLSIKGVEYAQKEDCKLLISLDCGIRAKDSVAAANKAGMDVIICDHHLPEGALPNALAVLNPRRQDCSYPYKELSACGVAFKLVQGICHRLELKREMYESLLDLVVMSIASDVVPLTGENRILAYFGLQQINREPRLGVKALMRCSRKTPPLNISDLVFGLGPRINAAGRMADASLAVRLLLSQDEGAAFQLAEYLNRRNDYRKELDQKTTEEARNLVEQIPDWKAQKVLLLYQPHWHKGVLGIVASRLAELYHRPVIVLADDEDGNLSGSGRSVPGFDLHDSLQVCEKYLLRFGGHRQAAGMSLLAKNLESFRKAFYQTAQAQLKDGIQPAVQALAGEIDLRDLNSTFWNSLQGFAPFGPANHRPIFLSRQVVDTGYAKLLKERHLRMSLRQNGSRSIAAIAFDMGDKLGEVTKGAFDICYVLEQNHWKGKKSLQLMVKDILPST